MDVEKRRFRDLFESSRNASQALSNERNASIVRNTGTDAKYIYVIFEDVAPSDWAGEGKLFGAPATKDPV